MKIKLAAVLAFAALLTGCSNTPNNSLPETEAPVTEEAADFETANTSAPGITTEKTAAPEAVTPAGGTAAQQTEAAAEAQPESGAPAEKPSVSLTEDPFADIKAMTDFKGDYVSLEESGLEYRIEPVPTDDSYFSGNFSEDGKIYFYRYKGVDAYDIESGELTSTELDYIDNSIVYADSEYVVSSYFSEDSRGAFTYDIYRLADGELLGSLEDYYSLYRVGNSFFGTVYTQISIDGMEYPISTVRRLSPGVFYESCAAVSSETYGVTADGIVIGKGGELILLDRYTRNAISFIGLAPDEINGWGDYVSYAQYHGKDDIFGIRYDVGYYPHPKVQKHVFTTAPGITVEESCACDSGYLYAHLWKKDRSANLLFDTEENRAVVINTYMESSFDTENYVRVDTPKMCGKWLCLQYYQYNEGEGTAKILFINTERPE